jgi:tripartite ATP-independent transporter DctP family solute receptor
MTQLNRRQLLAGAGALLAAPAILKASPARAAEFSYKYSSDLKSDHPTVLRMTQAADAIRKETGGKLDIQVFPDSQLGSTTNTLSQLRDGSLEFLTYSPVVFSAVVPVSAIGGIGFAFPDYATVWQAMDGELGRFIRGEIAKTGIVVMEKCWDQGFRQITSSTKPIVTPADLKGFKIRVPISPLWTSMFEAFQASPVSLNVAEIYPALQTKIAEGWEAPLAGHVAFKSYEVQKYLSMTSHMWDGLWFLANKAAWQALPADMRAIAAKHINQAGLDQRADLEKQNVELQSFLESKGMVTHQVDRNAFREVLRKANFFSQWKQKLGAEAWTLLEKYCGNIA